MRPSWSSVFVNEAPFSESFLSAGELIVVSRARKYMKAFYFVALAVALGVQTNAFGDIAPEVARICEGPLKVGTAGYYPPFLLTLASASGTKVMGLDIDLIVEIRAKLCDEAFPKEAQKHVRLFQVPFDELFDRLRQGEFHMIAAGISMGEPLPGREDVIYSYPYVNSELAFAVRAADRNSIPSDDSQSQISVKDCLSRFAEKRVVVEKGTKSESVAKRLRMRTIAAESGHEFAVADAQNVDLILNDKDVLSYQVKDDHRAWTLFSCSGHQEPLVVFRGADSIAVRKRDTALLLEIDSALNELLGVKRIEELQRFWLTSYTRGAALNDHALLDASPVPYWDQEIKRSKVDLRLQPLTIETIEGATNHKMVNWLPTFSWLFPVDGSILPYIRISGIGPQLGYTYKRRKDADLVGIGREQGWDISAKVVLNPSPLLKFLHAQQFDFIKPQVAIGGGHRRVDSQYSAGQPPSPEDARKVTVVGISTPLMPPFHGVTLNLEYKRVATGKVFFGNTLDQTTGLGLSYVYPH